MTPTNQALVLKTDRRGRVRVPRERRDAILDEFERSGMSGAAFSQQLGIKYQTFVGWRTRRRRVRAAAAPAPVSFAEVMVDHHAAPKAAGADGLRIELPGGACVRVCGVHELALAAALLRTLAQTERPC
jgi:hypothetical protein